MYDTETFETILRRMLARVAAKFDKREGAIIYDTLAPAAVELQNLYIALETVLNEVFPDTASREYLIKHCTERGLTPKPASYAIVKGQFTPATVEIPIGARFSHEDFNYTVTEKIADGQYYLQCETLGSEPNGMTGQLIPIDYINGLQTAEIVEVVIVGEDEEDTETLRNRCLSSYDAESFGGNLADYKAKIKAISGVGQVKIYSGSKWNGGGTVKAVITDAENGVPTDELVDQVQTAIDPEGNQGEGNGLAPIGHFVTVMGVNKTTVAVGLNLVFSSGYSWTTCEVGVVAAIEAYFAELNTQWDSSDTLIVRIGQIESRVLQVPGVLDYTTTTLNGKAENLKIDKDSLVTLGDVTNAE